MLPDGNPSGGPTPPGGAKPKLAFGEVREGQPFPPRQSAPLTAELFRDYAAAQGYLSPLHTDRAYAQARGYPEVVAPPGLLLALAAAYLTDLAGWGALQWWRARFEAKLPAGERLALAARVSGKRTERGRRVVVIAFSGTDAAGRTVLQGEAKAAART